MKYQQSQTPKLGYRIFYLDDIFDCGKKGSYQFGRQTGSRQTRFLFIKIKQKKNINKMEKKQKKAHPLK